MTDDLVDAHWLFVDGLFVVACCYWYETVEVVRLLSRITSKVKSRLLDVELIAYVLDLSSLRFEISAQRRDLLLLVDYHLLLLAES